MEGFAVHVQVSMSGEVLLLSLIERHSKVQRLKLIVTYRMLAERIAKELKNTCTEVVKRCLALTFFSLFRRLLKRVSISSSYTARGRYIAMVF